ncbi:hypothetical protein M0812_29441 [Anaeramoeba flamelloides]|uniref:Uncharacterized protein n=1 Tax=Anaeramoeba flamelloides TaxID=1746091 RepID=A0AAV7Y6P8_9EUKA|nr:hypothetical protein M0812_29441 [Anaeramoeba flamelloides]
MSEKRKQPNTNNSKITIITEEEIRKMYSSEVPRDYSHNKRKRKSYEKKFKFETVQEYMDSVITWKRLGSKRDVPHDTIRKWKSQVIKMYQDPSISALNREGNTILWDWIKKHLVMEGDEKDRTNSLQIEYGVWMKHRANILTLQKKSFKLRNSSSFSKTHGFNQRDTLVACIRADGARLAPMIIETRNAYLNKKDSSKSREKNWRYVRRFHDLFGLKAKRYSPLDNSFFGTFKRTRANCLPHMHNYTRILRLLIISKYYYDATEESVRGNFIKNGLALWKKGCTEKIESINNNLYPGVKIIKPTLKTRMDDIRFNGLTVKPHKGFVIYFLNGIRCDFTDLKKLSEDDNFGMKHRKKVSKFH